MKKQFGSIAVIITCFIIFIADSQNNSSAMTALQKDSIMTTHAKGEFDVKLTPQDDALPDDKSDKARLGRMLIHKQFRGDLEAISQGQMLTAMSSVKGSAGYVAMERVVGKLKGRTGSFALQHSGTMAQGAQELTITVVPDSGTDELKGITGKMNITIADGKHSYEFEYRLMKPQ
jgi:hypothetical protein